MSDVVEIDKVPMLYEYVQKCYAAMEEEAQYEDVETQEGIQNLLVYEGFLTHLVTDTLHLSVPYYTKLTRALKAMGCMSQLRRGGSSTPSKWLLFRKPTLASFTDPKVQEAVNKSATKDQRTRDLSTRVGSLEDNVEALMEHLGVPDGNG